jgi:hypothetical protein
MHRGGFRNASGLRPVAGGGHSKTAGNQESPHPKKMRSDGKCVHCCCAVGLLKLPLFRKPFTALPLLKLNCFWLVKASFRVGLGLVDSLVLRVALGCDH